MDVASWILEWLGISQVPGQPTSSLFRLTFHLKPGILKPPYSPAETSITHGEETRPHFQLCTHITVGNTVNF